MKKPIKNCRPSCQANPPVRGARLIYARVIEIRASKAGQSHICDEECRASGHRYKHRFREKFSIWGLPDGTWGLPNGSFVVVSAKKS